MATMASGKDIASHTSDDHGWYGVQGPQKNTSGCHVGEHHTLLLCWHFVVNSVLF
jgi:hypothetical protein